MRGISILATSVPYQLLGLRNQKNQSDGNRSILRIGHALPELGEQNVCPWPPPDDRA
jgi:hypothetical protein